MPNPLEFLRMRNIFNPQSMEMNNMPPMDAMGGMDLTPKPFTPNIPIQEGLPGQGGNMDIASRMAQLYTPETEATERFNTLAGGMPEYEKPGVWRSIAAALSAFGPGGHEVGMQVARQPYADKMTRWKEQLGPAQQAASLERQNNANERTMAYQTVNQELQSRKQDEVERKNLAEQKIRQQRADVYEFKSRNPGFKFDFSGPKVKVLNPTTGQVTVTQWDTGNLSDTDKINLEQKNAIERIEKTGEQARETEGVRQTGRESIAETRGWKVYNVPDPNNPGQMKSIKINEITGDVQELAKPVGPVASATGAGNRGELPTQTKVRQFNKAREIYNTRPDLRKYLKLGTNDFTVLESSSWGAEGKAADAAKIQELNQLLYGEGQPTTPGNTGGRGGGSGRGTQTPRFTPQKPPPAPQGWRYVPKPGGGWTAVQAGG
jgi:hypothetical protein